MLTEQDLWSVGEKDMLEKKKLAFKQPHVFVQTAGSSKQIKQFEYTLNEGRPTHVSANIFGLCLYKTEVLMIIVVCWSMVCP